MKGGKRMWQHPWRYKESIAIVAGFILVGLMLQLTIGNFNFTLLQSPVNLILGGFILLLLLIFALFRRSLLYKWFSGVPMAVTLIAALAVLGIIMGLTPQLTDNSEANTSIPSRFGFDRMTSSWSFVLVYLLTLLSLGALIVRRLITFRKKDYAFYLNHIGLWVLLFFSGLGAADMRRYVMHIRETETEWRVYNDTGDILELPIAIELNDFYMEEYPPSLAIIDRKTSAVQPDDKPYLYQIDEKRPQADIGKWQLTLKEYIHEAVRNSDSTYREVFMPGAAPAAKVEVINTETGVAKEGWVCFGNMSQLYMTLNLDTAYCVAMTKADPKRFVSDINVYTEDGKKGHALLEVNKPYKLGSWMLYQYDYDDLAGKMSTYSSIELVYDPWIIPVYIGISLLALGSICMLWAGNRRKEVSDDVE